MTDDRALLEAAARAAGLELESTEIEAGPYYDGLRLRESYEVWNPLEDDGDALRLAVKLRMEVDCMTDISTIAAIHDFDGNMHRAEEDYGKDRLAATRRAIVRAAARGERMEG